MKLDFKTVDSHKKGSLFGIGRGQIEVFNNNGTLCFRNVMVGPNLTEEQIREAAKEWMCKMVDEADVVGATPLDAMQTEENSEPAPSTEGAVLLYYLDKPGDFTVGGCPYENRYGSATTFREALAIARAHSGSVKGCAILDKLTNSEVYRRRGTEKTETFSLPTNVPLNELVDNCKWSGSWYPSESVFDMLKVRVSEDRLPQLREEIGRAARKHNADMESASVSHSMT